MARMNRPRPASAKRAERPLKLGIVLQGGGALGAYELGVLERLYAEPGFALSYVSGVSIGAITAAVLVGARSGDPIATLKSLWEDFAVSPPPYLHSLGPALSAFGNAAFYRMRTDFLSLPFWTSFYDVGPIRAKLAELVDFERLMASPVKLVVTATNVRTGAIDKFTNERGAAPLTVDHILASGSLPPGFPMTTIGDDRYWDGGLFDNTPLSALLKLIDPPDAPRTRLFVVNLFPKAGRIPHDMLAVADRIVEIIFANKMSKDVDIARTVNRFVALIDEAGKRHPDIKSLLDRPEYNDLRRYKALDDIVEITNTREEPVNAASDFSADTIAARIAAGFADADRALARPSATTAA
jgi:NTE family protein